MPINGFRPPLTKDDLRNIGLRNPGNADVTALLWEIKRMRALLLRADQLQRSVPEGWGGSAGQILNILRAELEGEPCIEEMPKLPE